MFTYYTYAFGLKQDEDISMLIKLLVSSINVVLHQHCVEDEDVCGRFDVHYHGIFELNVDSCIENEIDVGAIKELCFFFKYQICYNPFAYLVLLKSKKFTMNHVISSTSEPSDLEDLKKRVSSFQILNEEQQNLIIPFENFEYILSLISPVEGVFKPCSWNGSMSKNIGLTARIVDLCNGFYLEDISADYLTPEESCSYVIDWCASQNICPKRFVKDIVDCLDRKVPRKSALYFQGTMDSSITHIVNSISDACGDFAWKILEDTTGFAYYFSDCLDKRVITMMDPYFDGRYCTDKLLEILEGSISYVKQMNGFFMEVEPTPILVTTKEHGWENDEILEMAIKDRLINYYVNLKSYRSPKRKVHPLWVTILDARFRIFEYGFPGHR